MTEIVWCEKIYLNIHEDVAAEIIFLSIENKQSVRTITWAFSFVQHLTNLWVRLEHNRWPSISIVQHGKNLLLLRLGQNLKEAKEECKEWHQRRDRPFLLWRECGVVDKSGLSTKREKIGNEEEYVPRWTDRGEVLTSVRLNSVHQNCQNQFEEKGVLREWESWWWMFQNREEFRTRVDCWRWCRLKTFDVTF